MNKKDKLSSEDIRDATVETGLSFIPFIGSGLSSLYSSYKSKKRFQRLEIFYEEVTEKISKLEQSNGPIPKVEIHDEEVLISLIEKINDKVEQESLEYKKECLQRFFLHSMINSTTQASFDQRQFFLDTLSSMTLLECEMMVVLFKENRTVIVNDMIKPNIDQYAIVGSVGRLKSYGFITSYTGEFHVVDGGRDNSLHEYVRLSNYGAEFVKFCLVV